MGKNKSTKYLTIAVAVIIIILVVLWSTTPRNCKPPNQSKDVNVTVTGCGSVIITWASVDCAVKYYVYRKSSTSEGRGISINNCDDSLITLKTSAVFTDIQDYIQYFAVSAINSYGES